MHTWCRQFGYLDLVLSAVDYTNIRRTLPLLIPVHPGTFTPVPRTVTVPATTRTGVIATTVATAAAASAAPLSVADIATQK